MIKNFPDTLFDEMKLLAKFPTHSQLEGIKIHQDANPSVITAAKSLFDKGLISLPDGGYLTDSGIETLDHLHRVLATLS
ncbi:TIGR02647 family protein [Psychromonas sp. psych-6C06]|uniref:TIGR02647 family protein n=1 Tax=Psychromonas sp. psych-6C06 TaxID=2058089 RepID=UPI000C32360D|nr:TIGR02647 family protein [Psychromonas sp. psych-6C06]PKF63569.1 TIGR02647 family protein [Psychromonas sp. psych-6C06]